MAALFFGPSPAWATEDYADVTGQGCVACHVDPDGGGVLTSLGNDYREGGYKWPVEASAGKTAYLAAKKVFRFSMGFLHFLAAIIWFGTIFYVHIVLRPQYAKGGLPKTEMRIAWGSMLVLALTGVALTTMRFHSLSSITATYAGKLFLAKISLFLALVVSAGYVTQVLSPKLKKLRKEWQKNDGTKGRPAWVKVGDLLYDVTESSRWVDGLHFRRHQAGQDMTEALKGAPHGPEKLEGFPCFSLKGGTLGKESAEIRILYFMAYLNLFVALGIIVILSLWRWG
jgi:predicted heme/steroid binding protein